MNKTEQDPGAMVFAAATALWQSLEHIEDDQLADGIIRIMGTFITSPTKPGAKYKVALPDGTIGRYKTYEQAFSGLYLAVAEALTRGRPKGINLPE